MKEGAGFLPGVFFIFPSIIYRRILLRSLPLKSEKSEFKTIK
jgi:hypothetical protein